MKWSPSTLLHLTGLKSDYNILGKGKLLGENPMPYEQNSDHRKRSYELITTSIPGLTSSGGPDVMTYEQNGYQLVINPLSPKAYQLTESPERNL